MTERIIIDASNPEERRLRYKSALKRLIELNGPTRIVRAIAATRTAVGSLHPYQPPDILGLKRDLERLGIETDHLDGIAGDLPAFVGAYLADRPRWDQALSEWGL